MKKSLMIILGISIIAIIFSGMILYEVKKNAKDYSALPVEGTINEDIKKLKDDMLSVGEWVDITEDDKITFAFGSLPPVIERTVSSLEKGYYIICYVVGGRLDPEGAGTYIILKGYDTEGKVKVLASINDYAENSYVFERIFENVNKIMFFDKEVNTNE